MYLNGLSFIFCMIYTHTCIDKVFSVLLPLLQGTKGYCCVRATTIDQMVTRLLQPCYQVENVSIPGFRQPCKAWLLQCYTNKILPGSCSWLVTRLSEAGS